MRVFEVTIKPGFKDIKKRWAIGVNVDKDFPEAGITGGFMYWTGSEIASCFEEVLNIVLSGMREKVDHAGLAQHNERLVHEDPLLH